MTSVVALISREICATYSGAKFVLEIVTSSHKGSHKPKLCFNICIVYLHPCGLQVKKISSFWRA